MDIRLTEDLTTAEVFPDGGPWVDRTRNWGVSLINPRAAFLKRMDQIYPAGLHGRTMLDCGCNAAGCCFWAAERGIAAATGFDVREHWIRQARFVQAQRTIASTKPVRVFVADLADLPQRRLEPSDIVLFRGLFSHLADPAAGLRIAAGLCRDVILFTGPVGSGEPDGSLRLATENPRRLMAGTSGLRWIPSGPRVIGRLLRSMGFVDIRLLHRDAGAPNRSMGRMEIVASRNRTTLQSLDAPVLVS